jgi:hypothetical protein
MTEASTSYNRILEMSVQMGWGIRKSMAIFKLGEQLPLLQASLHDEDPDLCREWTLACQNNLGKGMLMLAERVFLLSRYELLTLKPVANYENGRLSLTDRNGQTCSLLIRTEFQREVLSVLSSFVLSSHGNPAETLAAASDVITEHKYFLGNLVTDTEVNLSLLGEI